MSVVRRSVVSSGDIVLASEGIALGRARGDEKSVVAAAIRSNSCRECGYFARSELRKSRISRQSIEERSNTGLCQGGLDVHC